jgi:anaerobic selenocysteine-containing dehydrogenase
VAPARILTCPVPPFHMEGIAMTATPMTHSGFTTADNASSLLSFRSGSAALEPDAVVASACQFCNSNCRINVSLKAGRIIEIDGEHRDPVQAGELCVKAPMMTEVAYSPGRVTTPLRRVRGAKGSADSVFEPVC